MSSWVLSYKLVHTDGCQEQGAGNRCQIPGVVEVDGTEIHLSRSGDLEERGFQQWVSQELTKAAHTKRNELWISARPRERGTSL